MKSGGFPRVSIGSTTKLVIARYSFEGCDLRHSGHRQGRAKVVVGSSIVVSRSQRKQYNHGDGEDPSIRAADDCPAVGNHPSHGVCSSGCDNDPRGAGVLPPYGGAVWKLHDAGQSFLLQGSGTNEYRPSSGAGCRAGSSPHNCCGTAGRLIRSSARGDSALPSFVSSCSTS